MAADTFDEFVKRHTQEAEKPSDTFDPKKTLSQWKENLNELYCAIETYLQSYIDTNQITIKRDEIQITEESLGTYPTDALTIKIGDQKVSLKPIGTMLIGVYGRVDISGPLKTLRIVLMEKGGPSLNVSVSNDGGATDDSSSRPFIRGEIDHRGWYFVTQPPNALAIAVGEDSFKDVLMEITGG